MHLGSGRSDGTRPATQGGAIYVQEGAYEENVDVDTRLTLIDEGADVYGCRPCSSGGGEEEGSGGCKSAGRVNLVIVVVSIRGVWGSGNRGG